MFGLRCRNNHDMQCSLMYLLVFLFLSISTLPLSISLSLMTHCAHSGPFHVQRSDMTVMLGHWCFQSISFHVKLPSEWLVGWTGTVKLVWLRGVSGSWFHNRQFVSRGGEPRSDTRWELRLAVLKQAHSPHSNYTYIYTIYNQIWYNV